MKIIKNILSDQSLNNINDYWSDDKERRISEDINGKSRDVVMLTDSIIKNLTGNDLKDYKVHSGFLSLVGEPFKVHCDLGNNPITHNLCINLLPNDQLEDQALVIMKQTSNYRMILVDDNTSDYILNQYRAVKYQPVYANDISEYVDNVDGTETVFNKGEFLHHVWQDTVDKIDIKYVIDHKYNQGIEFDAHHLHCGATADGDHKRMVLYVTKLN